MRAAHGTHNLKSPHPNQRRSPKPAPFYPETLPVAESKGGATHKQLKFSVKAWLQFFLRPSS